MDDGSSDATCDIIKKYTENHSYVVFVKFPQNRGTNAARNEAVRRARGKWCIILDSDDYFVDDALLTISQTMKEHTQYKKHTQGFFRAGGSQKEPYIPYETGVHIQRGDNRDGPAVRLQGGERRDEQDTGCQRRGRVRAFQGGTAGHAV